MRVFVRWSVVITLALVTLAGCNSNDKDKVAHSGNTQAPPRATNSTQPQLTRPATGDNVRRITTVELQDALNKGEAVVVDVRNDAAYRQSRIKGAILIPVTEVAQHLNELPRDKMIVTYCAWPAEHTSAGAVLTLKQNGFDNAAALLGGLDAWKNAGLPVETGQ